MSSIIYITPQTLHYNREALMQETLQASLTAMAGAVEGAVRAAPWPADRALSFAVTLRKALPAGSNPEDLIVTLKCMAQSLPVSTLQTVTLETMPFLMRCVKRRGYELLVDRNPTSPKSYYVRGLNFLRFKWYSGIHIKRHVCRGLWHIWRSDNI